MSPPGHNAGWDLDCHLQTLVWRIPVKKTLLIGTLIALSAGVVAMAAWWHEKKNSTASGPRPAPAIAVGSPISTQPEGEPPNTVLPGLHECMTTAEGLRLKVVTAQPGLRYVDSVENGRLMGEGLPLFQELFVLDVVPSIDRPDWYLVSRSPRRVHRLGFLRAECVAVWPTRLGLRPVLPVLFYADSGDAETMAREGVTKAAPIGRATPDTERKYLPWPIVNSYTVTNDSGQVVEVAKLNLLGERRLGDDVGDLSARTVHYSEERKKAIARAVDTITLAFCVDNTNSTDPFVPQIVKFIVETSATVHEHRPKLRLGLTLYRDDVDGLSWNGSVTRTLWGGSPQPMDSFLREVRPITAPNESSEDWPECSYQGLLEVLNATQWEKLSHKVVVWIGDNSAHTKGSAKNPTVGPKDVIDLAKQKGVTIHAVAIKGGGGDVEQLRHWTQCRDIAEATGGQVFGLKDAESVAARIAQAVQGEEAIVRKNSEDLQRIANGELTVADYMATKDREELRRRYQFVRLLDSGKIDLEGFEPNQPTFIQGWVPTQLPNGQPLFERMVYVSRVELDVLLGELNNLVALLRHDSTKGVLNTFAIGLGARVGDRSFFSTKRDGDIPFDVFMAARGIPMRTGITMKTRDGVLGMDAEEKLLLKARLINEVIPNLTNARSSTAFTLTGDFDFGWIPEHLLP